MSVDMFYMRAMMQKIVNDVNSDYAHFIFVNLNYVLHVTEYNT